MDIVDPRIEGYMRTLQARHDEPVLKAERGRGAVRAIVPTRDGVMVAICPR